MAAITSIASGQLGTKLYKTWTAQATTDSFYIAPPVGAQFVEFVLDLTSVTGSVQWSFNVATLKDDAKLLNVAEHAALTAVTAASILVADIGPSVVAADDVTNAAAANSRVALNAPLPGIIGVKATVVTGPFTATLRATFR